MRTFSVLALALSLGQALAQCNADNCARAVTGTFRSLQAGRSADCVSFQQCTVTPATSTVTATSTITPGPVTQTTVVTTVTTVVATTITPAPAAAPNRNVNGGVPLHFKPNQKRQASGGAVTVCPSAVPTYASACSGSSRYASACSCDGVTKTTTTVATPTTTVTVTTTLPASVVTVPVTAVTTVTTTVTATPTSMPFAIRVGPSGSSFVNLVTLETFKVLEIQNNTGSSAFSVYKLVGSSLYTRNGKRIADTDGGSAPSYVFMDPLADQASTGYPLVVASLGPYNSAAGGYPLTVTGSDRPLLQMDSNGYLQLVSGPTSGYSDVAQLYAVRVA